MITLNVSELELILATTPPDQNIMLVGRHGIGKSRILSSYFKPQPVISFFLGQMSDPGDLIGLMYRDETTHRSRFMPPYWWPEGGEPVVLFLDELNRARPEILQAVMDLALNRRLAGRDLPAGSRIVAAINHGDEYQTTDLDPALVSRFNLYEFQPTREEWLLWATAAQLDPRVVHLIQHHPELLDGEAEAYRTLERGFRGESLEKIPDRRAWERVAHYIAPLAHLEAGHIKAVAGMVGAQAALQLQKSLNDQLPITAEDLLLRYARIKSRLETLPLPQSILLNEQILYTLQAGRLTPAQQRKGLPNLLLYLQQLQQREQREAVAHFASLLTQPRFSRVAALVLIDSAEIMTLLTDYIDTIAL